MKHSNSCSIKTQTPPGIPPDAPVTKTETLQLQYQSFMSAGPLHVNLGLHACFRAWWCHVFDLKLDAVFEQARTSRTSARSVPYARSLPSAASIAFAERIRTFAGPSTEILEDETGKCKRCGGRFISLNCKKCKMPMITCRLPFIKYPDKRSHCESCRAMAAGECPVWSW